MDENSDHMKGSLTGIGCFGRFDPYKETAAHRKVAVVLVVTIRWDSFLASARIAAPERRGESSKKRR
jgi:hypothetical protein